MNEKSSEGLVTNPTFTILVVDDEPSNLELIATILRHAGYQAETASSAEMALQILHRIKPHLIISDIMMPAMSGYTFYQEIRKLQRLHMVPFIFLSAKGKRSDIRYGKELGADDYLTKPFSRQDLLIAVKNKLRRVQDYLWDADQRLDVLKDEIMRSLSHEFRTPLTIIKGSIEFMAQEMAAQQQDILQEWLSHLKHNSERLENLVEDFLLMVKAESGNLAQEFTQTKAILYLSALLPFILRPYQKLAEQRKLLFHADIAPDLPMIEGCERHLIIILSKLLDNAIKFAPKNNGEIRIQVIPQDKFVCIYIQNNGEAISPEFHDKVFEKFYQIERFKQEQQGAGVGLTIAKQLAELNGGSIQIHNHEKTGSVFEVFLPIHRASDSTRRFLPQAEAGPSELRTAPPVA